MSKYLPVFKKLNFWLVVLLLAFVPLFPKLPVLNVSNTFVAIRLEDFLVALVIGLWVIQIIVSKQIKLLLNDRLVQVLALFFLIGLVSLYSAGWVSYSIKPHLGLFHYLRRIELMLLLPVVLWSIRTKEQVILCLKVLLGTVILVDIYALGQQYLGWPVISTTNSEFSKGLILYLTPGARVNSTFAGHYDLAVFLVMFLTTTSALFFYFKHLWVKALLLSVSGLSFFVLMLTAARLSFVAVVGGVILSFLLTGKKIFVGLMILVAIAAVLYPSPLRDRLISTVEVAFQNNGPKYTSSDPKHQTLSDINIPTLHVQTSSRPAQLKDGTQSSSSTDSGSSSGEKKVASDIVPGEPTDLVDLAVYRSFAIRVNQEWPRALRAFYKNPLLGTGYSSLDLATDNDFLRLLGEVGLLGSLAFVLLMVLIIKNLWQGIKSADRFIKYVSAGVLALTAAFLLNGLFIDVFEASKVATLFWMVLGMNLALIRKVE